MSEKKFEENKEEQKEPLLTKAMASICGGGSVLKEHCTVPLLIYRAGRASDQSHRNQCHPAKPMDKIRFISVNKIAGLIATQHLPLQFLA